MSSLSVGMSPFVPDYNKFTQNPQTVINTDAKAQDVIKENTAAGVKQKKAEGVQECQTCKNRRYQDGSNDPGVSFKTPGHVSPEASYAAVASHENEHVSNEQANARSNGRRVVSQSVQIFMETCPECGKAFAAGGVTKTTTAAAHAHNETKGAETEQT
jgi:ribosomal protein L37AE/L43A